MDVKFAYQANCWGPLGGNAVGVTSIGQLTYKTFGNIGRAIAEIGAVGYQGVELFDGNVVDYPGGSTTLSRTWRARRSDWSPSIPARTSYSPTFSIRNSDASRAWPMQRQQFPPSTWSLAGAPSAWRESLPAITSVSQEDWKRWLRSPRRAA